MGVLSSDWTLLPGGHSTLRGLSPLEAPLSLLLSPSPTPLLATPLPGPSVPATQIPCLSSSEQRTQAAFSTLLEAKEYKE